MGYSGLLWKPSELFLRPHLPKMPALSDCKHDDDFFVTQGALGQHALKSFVHWLPATHQQSDRQEAGIGVTSPQLLLMHVPENTLESYCCRFSWFPRGLVKGLWRRWQWVCLGIENRFNKFQENQENEQLCWKEQRMKIRQCRNLWLWGERTAFVPITKIAFEARGDRDMRQTEEKSKPVLYMDGKTSTPVWCLNRLPLKVKDD